MFFVSINWEGCSQIPSNSAELTKFVSLHAVPLHLTEDNILNIAVLHNESKIVYGFEVKLDTDLQTAKKLLYALTNALGCRGELWEYTLRANRDCRPEALYPFKKPPKSEAPKTKLH